MKAAGVSASSSEPLAWGVGGGGLQLCRALCFYDHATYDIYTVTGLYTRGSGIP